MNIRNKLTSVKKYIVTDLDIFNGYQMRDVAAQSFTLIMLIMTITFLTQAQDTGVISLVGKIEWPGITTTDIWGYMDKKTGKEYALVCRFDPPGLIIVDATNPIEAATISLPDTRGFDVKIWQQYAYVVSGTPTVDGVIIDLADPANPVIIGSMAGAHNIFIDELGFLYASAPGFTIFDLNPDPINPTFISYRGTEGHDVTVIGDILYDFHGSVGANIYDISNRSDPQLLGSLSAPFVNYYHNGWPTKDGHYLFMTDELSSGASTPDITVWDIQEPKDAMVVGEYGDNNTTIHNVVVIDDRMFASYYTAGFRVFDISIPSVPKLIGTYDTTPQSGEALLGAFGVYPFTTSGHIYVTSTETMFSTQNRAKGSLYIFEVEGVTSSDDEPEIPEMFILHQNYPNPFNPVTSIQYAVGSKQFVTLKVYDLPGKEVATLVNEEKPAGVYKVEFNANEFNLSSGVYFYRLKAGDFNETKKIILMK